MVAIGHGARVVIARNRHLHVRTSERKKIMVDNILAAAFLVFVGGIFGWLFAHGEIAKECERQGSFYVGESDYKCEVIKK